MIYERFGRQNNGNNIIVRYSTNRYKDVGCNLTESNYTSKTRLTSNNL